MTEVELMRIYVGNTKLSFRVVDIGRIPHFFSSTGSLVPRPRFADMIETLARNCFVVAPDLPGFGDFAPIERPSFSRSRTYAMRYRGAADSNPQCEYRPDPGLGVMYTRLQWHVARLR